MVWVQKRRATIGDMRITDMSFLTRELAEKLIVSLLAIMFLCSGCSNVNVGENIKKEPQLIHRILSEDKEEFQEFLTTDWEFSHEEEAIEILTYDLCI